VEGAIKEYNQALAKEQKVAAIHLNLASSYIKKNNLPKAIRELNIAAEITPQAVQPHAILSFLYSAQGKFAAATREYEVALENAAKLNSGNLEIYRNLGILYLEQKRFKDAEKLYRSLLQLAPQDAQAHFYLGSVYYELKNSPEAQKELEAALALKPDYHEVLNFLGYLYLEEDINLPQAEVMIRKALEFQPNNGAYLDSLGWFYFKSGKIQEAIAELEKASLLLADPIIFDHLGDAYLQTSEPAKAKKSWEESLKLAPGNKQVKEKLEKLLRY
jgi:tetratricopeptide (TPR) repeat protein